MDPDVIRAVYYEIKRLTAAGKRTKKARADYIAAIPAFESFTLCIVSPFQMALQKGHWNLQQQTAFHLRLDGGGNDWMCRLYADLTMYTSSVLPRMYDKKPLVNPARVKWHTVVKWMNGVRPYGWHWLEDYTIRTCAPDGTGRKRDRVDFEADFEADTFLHT